MASTTLVVCTAYLVGMIAIPEFIETEVVYFLDFLMNRQPCSGDYRFAWHGLTLALGGIVISVLTLATIQITQDEKAK